MLPPKSFVALKRRAVTPVSVLPLLLGGIYHESKARAFDASRVWGINQVESKLMLGYFCYQSDNALR